MNFKGLLAILGLIAVVLFARSDQLLQGEVRMDLVAGPSRLQSEFGPALSGKALDAYREWSRQPDHFGAFAATDFEDFGWVSKYNSIESAETAALAFCGVPDCRVFARSLPMHRAEEGELLVSQATADAFVEFLRLENAKAFAIHGKGAGGSWVGAGSLSSAIAGALKECDRRSRTAESDIPVSESIEGCRIVYAER